MNSSGKTFFSLEGVNTQEKKSLQSENFEEKTQIVSETKIKREEKKSEADKLQENEIERLDFRFTRYYSPVRGQKFWYQSEEYDFHMNCQGNCLTTADGHQLKQEESGKVVACPNEFKAGTRIYIENYGEVVCHDRGARINKDKSGAYHLDLWCGIGEQGVLNIKDQKQETYCYNPGPRKGYVIK